jgi:Na+/melibiose symporter-like transporter
MDTPPTAPPAATARQHGLVGFFINRDFALLWGGQTISAIGDATFAITLVLWVTLVIARNQAWTPLAVSGVLLATIAPELLIAPFAGVFADRWNKRHTMLAMDATRALLVALLALVGGVSSLPFLSGGRLSTPWQLGLIYCIVFLVSACSQFFNPSLFALIAGIVAEPDRARASGLRQGAASLAGIVGPSLAALLFFGVGIQWALFLNAISFAVSFLAVLAVHASAVAQREAEAEHEGLFNELSAGLRFYFGNRVLMTLLVAGVLTLLAFGTLNTLDIFFVTQNLRAAPDIYGILTSAQGIGLLAGAAFAGLYAQRLGVGHIFGYALVAWGITILIYARLTSIAPAVVLMGLTGFLLSAAQVAETPLFMHVTPQAFLGRAFAVFAPAISAAELVGIGLSGYLDSTLPRHFQARVLGITLGPVDMIFSAVGLVILAAGIFAIVNLRTISLEQKPPGDRARS